MKRLFSLLLAATAFTLPTMAAAQDGIEWRTWTGRLPSNAIRGGTDQNGRVPLYICRAHYVNGVHPGKLLNRQCHIGWGEQEIILRHFEVLVSTNRHYRERERDRDWDRDWDRDDYRDRRDWRR